MLTFTTGLRRERAEPATGDGAAGAASDDECVARQAPLLKARLDRSFPSTFGLKELQYFTEALQNNGLSKPSARENISIDTENTPENLVPGAEYPGFLSGLDGIIYTHD